MGLLLMIIMIRTRRGTPPDDPSYTTFDNISASNAFITAVGGATSVIGRKLALLISRKVVPFARLMMSSCAMRAQRSRKMFDTSFLGFIAMKP